MMDTVLNIGLNKDNVESLAAITGNNERFAWDSYRRLINMYGDVVKGIPHEAFEEKLDELKKKVGATNDVELNAEQLKELCDDYKNVFIDNGQVFPEDPKEQLKSWYVHEKYLRFQLILF